ncbi:hypothetical protein PHLCEN_2v9293 [Hermanssonia centrifuga]|uniref:Uncharacterized protein n=1 Tax=Hermanssonia centrifuga TaxID=98765 RepID=A0A2R6NR92_9APHY|nr:hypothetical protein PHLCEN_2v9293 [Hermanssonia centrifuga]
MSSLNSRGGPSRYDPDSAERRNTNTLAVKRLITNMMGNGQSIVGKIALIRRDLLFEWFALL